MEKSEHKLELMRRIAELEKKGLWHLDVEDDPETYPLMPDKVDYLNEKFINKIKNKIANKAGAKFFDKMIADRQLIIKEVKGIENFTAVEGGKLVTCNHFSVGDNYAVWVALRDYMGGKLLYKGPLPYQNGERGERIFPFVKQDCLRLPGAFFGSSVVDRLIPVQRAYNAVRNRKHEFLNRLSMGVLTVEDGSVDTDELTEEGLVLPSLRAFHSLS